jgi:acetolactate synthase-1/2/3 large subunit
MIGRHYPVDLGINADAKTVMVQLSSVAATSPIPRRLAEARQKRLVDLQGSKKQWQLEVMQVQQSGSSLINPRSLMKTMREVLPNDTQIVAGAGNPGIWSNLLEIRETGSYMKPVGFGNMGFALPAAVAVKLAHPDKLVACIIGDGSLGMCISEIETAVREKAPVIIVVMNNLSYGNIKQEQLVHYGPRYIGVDFTDIDYSLIAKGFGAEGHRVADPSELSAALQTAVASESTYLLDVRIDPDENVWNDPF